MWVGIENRKRAATPQTKRRRAANFGGTMNAVKASES